MRQRSSLPSPEKTHGKSCNCNCRFKKRLKENFDEYCRQSTIHGVKYVGEERKYKRILWLIICLSLLFFCAIQIREIVFKWQQDPIQFSLDTKYTPIDELNFPAVTICTQSLSNRLKFNFSDYLIKFINDDYENLNEEDLKLFDSFSKVCGKYLMKYIDALSFRTDKMMSIDAKEMFETLEQHVLSHYLKFVFCKGVVPKQLTWGCNYRLTKILLKEGMCYSFNVLPKEYIFREDVYYPMASHPNLVLPDNETVHENVRIDAYLSPGLNDYIEFNQTGTYQAKDRRDRFHMRTRFYEDFFDPICKQEPIVFIHNPYDIPWDFASKGYGIDFEQFERVVLNIAPKVIKTEEKLKSDFTPEERGCYFPYERHLRYFKRYSEQNCELECLTNASLTHIDYRCSMFWMPSQIDANTTCHMNKFFSDVDSDFLLFNYSCNCLPDCNSVDYSVRKIGSHVVFSQDIVLTQEDYETNQSGENMIIDFYKSDHDYLLFLSKNEDFDFHVPVSEALKQANLTPDFDVWAFKTTEIEVHYEDSKFLAMRRHLAYTFADFLSQIGGILGCFMGMSILSIFELVYFCTVRMCRKQEKHEDTDIES